MPFDSAGKHHLNSQKALRADKMKSATDAKAPDSLEKDAKEESSDRVHTIHDHGDGTYHIDDADGDRTDHADADSLKGHIDALVGGDDTDAPQDKDDDQPDQDERLSYRTLSGL